MNYSPQKIFGIGLNKTGTSTLSECGRILNYRCKSCDRELLKDAVITKNFERIRNAVNNFDLFEDWPWPLIYKELDQMFPDSKFILTTRITANIWLESLKKHSMRTPPSIHCRKLAYGYNYPHRFEQEHIDTYIRHNQEVREYFKGRNSNFIELCWEKGDGWEKLCHFLDTDIPDLPFPHANKGSDQPVNKNRYKMNLILSRLVN